MSAYILLTNDLLLLRDEVPAVSLFMDERGFFLSLLDVLPRFFSLDKLVRLLLGMRVPLRFLGILDVVFDVVRVRALLLVIDMVVIMLKAFFPQSFISCLC